MSDAMKETPVLLEQSSVELVDEVQDFLDVWAVQLDSCCPRSKGQCGKGDDKRNVADAHAKRLVQRQETSGNVPAQGEAADVLPGTVDGLREGAVGHGIQVFPTTSLKIR